MTKVEFPAKHRIALARGLWNNESVDFNLPNPTQPPLWGLCLLCDKLNLSRRVRSVTPIGVNGIGGMYLYNRSRTKQTMKKEIRKIEDELLIQIYEKRRTAFIEVSCLDYLAKQRIRELGLIAVAHSYDGIYDISDFTPDESDEFKDEEIMEMQNNSNKFLAKKNAERMIELKKELS